MESAHEYNENLLDDVDYSLCQANHAKRLANYFIDIVATYATFFVIAFLIAISMRSSDTVYKGGDSATVIQILAFIFFIFFYAVVEGISRGKSLGKLITGTRAVNSDGTRIDFTTAFIRSLIRIVPFEPFSALGSPSTPWHDKWTNTYVIDERLSRLPRA